MNKLIILDKYKNLNIINKANIKDTEIKLNKDYKSINIKIKYNDKEEIINTTDTIKGDDLQVLNSYINYINNYDYIKKYIKDFNNSYFMNYLELLNFIKDLYSWGFDIDDISFNTRELKNKIVFDSEDAEIYYNLSIETKNKIITSDFMVWNICFDIENIYIWLFTGYKEHLECYFETPIQYKLYNYNNYRQDLIKELRGIFTVYYDHDDDFINNIIK